MLNGAIRDTWDSNKVISRLAEYIMRAPIGENRILDYNKQKAEVTIQYRKRDRSGNKTKEMDKETMSVLDFIARLVQHIPDRSLQTVRYYGAYSNRVRGMRKEKDIPDLMILWRNLIH